MNYKDLTQGLRKIENWLCECQERDLFDTKNLERFRLQLRGLEHNIRLSEETGRKLVIGVVGDVKAGKSSLLNALLFNGEDLLPKASTPMTASLTKLSYGEKPQATVFFYTCEDWDEIRKKSSDYDERLIEGYQKYCEKLKNDAHRTNNILTKDIRDICKTPKVELPSMEEYETKIFRGTFNDEYMKSAKELTQMVKGNEEILEKLGTSERLDANTEDTLKEKLKEYVGAKAKYTPIVNYVELCLPKDCLQELEIFDTPGLNDPIISRGEQTKTFLRGCDVALLLSRCVQFMPESTVKLMAQRMPRSGVQDILVIGSQFDNGLASYKGKKFNIKEAYQKSCMTYINSFNSSLKTARDIYPDLEAILERFQRHKPIFVSAMCESAARKLKKNRPLTDEEELMKANLSMLDGFQWNEEFLVFLSGMGKLHDALDDVRLHKEETIARKNANFLDQAKFAMKSLIEQIQQYVLLRKKTLKEIDEDNPARLADKFEALKEILASSRTKLSALFQIAGNNAEKSAIDITSQIISEENNYTHFKVEAKTHNETRSYDEGWWIFKRTTYRDYTVTTYHARRSDVAENLEKFYSKCMSIINAHFSSLFSRDKLRQDVKEIVLRAFQAGGGKYDEGEVLTRLDVLFSEIEIPKLAEISLGRYMDRLDARCPEATVINDDIDRLADGQMRLLGEMATEFQEKVNNNINSLKNSMREQACSFADSLVERLESEQNILMNQLQTKEQALKDYDSFERELRKKKQEIEDLFQNASA